MSEENNKPEDEELDESEEGTEEELDESEQDEEEGSSAGALAGALAGAAAAGAMARKGGKKPAKPTAKSKKGKAVPAKAGANPASAPKATATPNGVVDLNAKVAEIQKLTDKNTEWTIAGYKFTPAKLMILGTILSSALGGLYGAFEVYKDYQAMKKQITNYVAPDLSVFDKRLEVVTEKAEKSVQYTQDIKNDLKQDIRRLEGVVENVERSSKQNAREADLAVREVQQDLRKNSKEMDQTVKQLQREVDQKIQKAMDNPLAGK
jgi:hypothetical protein